MNGEKGPFAWSGRGRFSQLGESRARPRGAGRETITATTSFACSGEAPFDVSWTPGTGSGFGSTTCHSGTGTSDIPIGRSLQAYTVTVTVDEGVDWTLDVLLAPPKGR